MESDETLPEAIRTFGFSADELDEATRASAIYKGLISLLVARGAKDFAPPRSHLRSAPGKEIEDHHIFPQQFLKNNGIKGYAANSILNRTPILASTNRAISADAPYTYLNSSIIVGDQPIDELMKGHAIPSSAFSKEFAVDLYNQFRNERRALLVEMISQATGQEISAGDSSPQQPRVGDLGEASSDELEV